MYCVAPKLTAVSSSRPSVVARQLYAAQISRLSGHAIEFRLCGHDTPPVSDPIPGILSVRGIRAPTPSSWSS